MLLKLYTDNPNEKTLRQVADVLRGGGVIVYPTDTVYALGCSLSQPKAIERMRAIKGKKETEMSLICSDLSHLSDYARVDNATFKLLRRNLPGPFTFILPASSRLTDKVMQGRKTVGIRVPDNTIALAIVSELGVPLVSTSVRTDGVEEEYITDPELIEERYPGVDLVVDGGIGSFIASTVVDCSEGEIEIVREGAGTLEF